MAYILSRIPRPNHFLVVAKGKQGMSRLFIVGQKRRMVPVLKIVMRLAERYVLQVL